MRIAVVIPTYDRPDGRTPSYLLRALESVEKQTHTDYDVFVIGDNYTNKDEFCRIKTLYPWAVFINLPRAIEREKYRFGTMELWCAGGVNASNIGIDIALKKGFKYVCVLGHDDWWVSDHLEKINAVIEEKKPLFVCTISTWMNKTLPEIKTFGDVVDFYPIPSGMISSSACVDYGQTRLRARDVFAETGKAEPADADLWRRMTREMKATGKKGYLITSLTCRHDEEGYALRESQV